MRKELQLLLLGGISPFIGVLIFLVQIQINPNGFIIYRVVQSIISAIFLSYFFLCGYFFSSIRHPKSLYFFVIPILFCFVDIVSPRIQEYVVLAVIVEGILAPFHYVLPDLFFPADKYQLIPRLSPLILCWIVFNMGKRVSVYLKGRRV